MVQKQKPAVMILAAGMGKRMRSSLPKVLHEIAGEPLLFQILNRIREATADVSVAIVVGYQREKIEEAVKSNELLADLDIHFIHQAEQKGTGHAARCAMESGWGQERIQNKETIVVFPGDMPLISRELVQCMLEPLGKMEAIRILTCELADPTGYGRIVRRGISGPPLRIVEEKDATPREREIREVANSIYTFESQFLVSGLQKISNKNAQGEYYLTDLVAKATAAKKKITVLKWKKSEELRGINDLWELAQAGAMLNERCIKEWSARGVKFLDPSRTRIDLSVIFEENVIVYPGVILEGKTKISRGSTLGPNVYLKNTEVGETAHIKAGTIAEDSKIGEKAQIGPYAHLRPQSVVGKGAKIGNFVELKKTTIGPHTSVAHLSYLGDAEVGADVNIGCGFVTCNFDGRIINGERKHRTIIEDDVFLGSDCQTIAPVRVGKGAYVASGSTITEDVPADALAIARSRQVNKPGYAEKLRKKEKCD